MQRCPDAQKSNYSSNIEHGGMSEYDVGLVESGEVAGGEVADDRLGFRRGSQPRGEGAEALRGG